VASFFLTVQGRKRTRRIETSINQLLLSVLAAFGLRACKKVPVYTIESPRMIQRNDEGSEIHYE